MRAGKDERTFLPVSCLEFCPRGEMVLGVVLGEGWFAWDLKTNEKQPLLFKSNLSGQGTLSGTGKLISRDRKWLIEPTLQEWREWIDRENRPLRPRKDHSLAWIQVWDFEKRTPKHEHVMPVKHITAARLGHHADHIIIAGSDDIVRVVDFHSGKTVQQFTMPNRTGEYSSPDLIRSINISTDGKRCVATSLERIRLWDLEKQKAIVLEPRPPDGQKRYRNPLFGGAQITPDGKWVVALLTEVWNESGRPGHEFSVDIWNAATGKFYGGTAALDDETLPIIVHPDSRHVFMRCSRDPKSIVCWDVIKKAKVAKWTFRENIGSWALSPDGTQIITSHGVNLQLWRVQLDDAPER